MPDSSPRRTPGAVGAVGGALGARLDAVRARIATAARSAGRDPAGIELVAITKSVGAETAAELLDLGVTDLGESRLQDLEAKARALAAPGTPGTPSAIGRSARWHFVGHLQRNKA